MKTLAAILACILLVAGLTAQVTKPVQVYSITEVLQWPTNFWFTNNIIRIYTNGVYLGTVQSLNFTYGVTGYVSGTTAYLGVAGAVSGGGGTTNYLLLETGDFILLETGDKVLLNP